MKTGMTSVYAIQYLYGADFSHNGTNTFYKWVPTTGEKFVNGVGNGVPKIPSIIMAVWDGGGEDTYDLPNFTTNVTITLLPGEWRIVSKDLVQHPWNPETAILPGNTCNTYLYIDPITGLVDLRSLIENAIGGSGNDLLIGNQINNGSFEFRVGYRAWGLIWAKSSFPAIRNRTVRIVAKRL